MGTVRLGFTGQREPIDPEQYAMLQNWIDFVRPDEVHHGDCLGADTAFHQLVRRNPETVVHVHPCDLDEWRAYCPADVLHAVKRPLKRNDDIVTASDLMLAVPKSRVDVPRSGTWYTINRARRAGVPTIVLGEMADVRVLKEAARFGTKLERIRAAT